ncbi:MAG: hypothetical protein AAF357_13520, partial [Verrucomicrobiota bacterium]
MNAIEYVRERMTPLEPIPTGVVPRVKELPEIQAAVFDVYGTLVISAAGDISLASDDQSVRGMSEALSVLGVTDVERHIQSALEMYRFGIRQQQELKRLQGAEFPEVEIREVWKTIASAFGGSEDHVSDAALIYECAVNPCWEMPNAAKTIEAVSPLHLGIISNAQFYTPSVVEGVSGIEIKGDKFERNLSTFSFQEGESKPSAQMFEKVARS